MEALKPLIEVLTSRGGVVGLLVLAIYGFYKEWWVFGAHYRAVLKDRDVYRDLVFTVSGVAEAMVKLRNKDTGERS